MSMRIISVPCHLQICATAQLTTMFAQRSIPQQCLLRTPAARATLVCFAARSSTQHRSERKKWPLAPPVQQVAVDPEALQRAQEADSIFQVHTVQWYPGHIAKAERQLKEQLKMVDVVLEVRDARIPQSTNHPQVPQWLGSKPRLVIINRADQISRADRAAWDKHFTQEALAAQKAAAEKAAAAARRKAAAQAAAAEQGQQDPSSSSSTSQQQQQQAEDFHGPPPVLPHQVFWTDGKTGAGIHAVRRAALKVSDFINAKRSRRGLAPRPVRACVIGFPNIGKSALINRLLGRRVVESAARPGVTRVLRWVRLGGELDLLDAPGIIPASFNNQTAAQRLAICNDTGEASYVDSLIAAALLIRIKQLPRNRGALAKLSQRYKLDPLGVSAEDFVVHVAGELFGGDKEQAGVRLLTDFRNGVYGEFALELPEDA